MKQSNEPNNSNNWFDLPEPTMRWLVHGLITSDDNTGFIGKPKSGKSTGIRNLTAAIIMGTKFLGRDIALAPHTGRVLYLHIDRKDRPHQVAAELRNLGITRDHKDRLLLLTEQDIPKNSTFEQRCAWLAEHVKEFQPHLVVIDLL